jgi:DNA-binding NarL/FixJ family response regulator
MSTGLRSIRVMTADDHPLLRQGIAALISTQPDLELIAEACDGEEAVALFRLHRPDVTLMDLQMPNVNGTEAISRIRSEFPDAKILVLSTYAGDVQILRAIKAGARGYLLKGNVRTELLEAIRTVHVGRKRIPSEIAAELADHAADDQLSSREIDVLHLIGAGNANKQIADKLSIGETTVKNHISNILSKLGANDRAHAFIIALQRGIIDLEVLQNSTQKYC